MSVDWIDMNDPYAAQTHNIIIVNHNDRSLSYPINTKIKLDKLSHDSNKSSHSQIFQSESIIDSCLIITYDDDDDMRQN